jgi:hypothetical protein
MWWPTEVRLHRTRGLAAAPGRADHLVLGESLGSPERSAGGTDPEITGHRYDMAALAIPNSGPELADAALAALLMAAGRDGAWHQG